MYGQSFAYMLVYTSFPVQLSLNSFLASASVDQLCMLITFSNSLGPDQCRQNIGLDRDPNRLTL